MVPVPAADDESEDEWVFVVAVAVVPVVLALDLLLSVEDIGEGTAACLLVTRAFAVAWPATTTRSFSLLLVTTVIVTRLWLCQTCCCLCKIVLLCDSLACLALIEWLGLKTLVVIMLDYANIECSDRKASIG